MLLLWGTTCINKRTQVILYIRKYKYSLGYILYVGKKLFHHFLILPSFSNISVINIDFLMNVICTCLTFGVPEVIHISQVFYKSRLDNVLYLHNFYFTVMDNIIL